MLLSFRPQTPIRIFILPSTEWQRTPGPAGADENYRYAFNGKEQATQSEWGDLTHYDYGFRIYNPAIAKFLSVDPLSPEYPELTPYQFASNRPIDGVDLDGLEFLGSNQSMFRFTRGGMYLDLTNANDVTKRVLEQLPGIIVTRNGEDFLEQQGTFISENGMMLSMVPPKGLFNAHFKFTLAPRTVHEFETKKRSKGRPNSSKRATYNKKGSVKSRRFTGSSPLPIGPNLPMSALVLAAEALKTYDDYKKNRDMNELRQIIVGDLETAYGQSAKYGVKIVDFLTHQLALGDESLIPEKMRNQEDVLRLANFILDGSGTEWKSLNETCRDEIIEVGEQLYFEIMRNEKKE